MKLSRLNQMRADEFVAAVATVFEHSPWVAEGAYAARPFASVAQLHSAMVEVVRKATRGEQVALLRAHPELAGKEAQQGIMTPDSTSEQGRLGFHALPKAELERMSRLNRVYREKFGFPCVIALREHRTRDTVFAEHERRLGNDLEAEVETGLARVFIIARGRLEKLFPT
jgi:2-oxo-4-hydroxy-4-carboxy-5-ureidoimidazoline decarboxylase